MNNQQKKEDKINELPVLALAAVAGSAGGQSNPILQELINELAAEMSKRKKKERDHEERKLQNTIQYAKEEAEMRNRNKRRCSHKNQANHTRLSGQVLSNGQLCLICKYCQQEYFDPPYKDLGQEAPPRDLYPPMDEIGGSLNQREHVARR
jgi:hypothetical protein